VFVVAVVQFDDGSDGEAECYYPVDQAVNRWNDEIKSNPSVVDGQLITKADFDMGAVLMGIAFWLQLWLTWAIWRYSHGLPALFDEDAGDQWFLAMVGGWLRKVTDLVCPSNSEVGNFRSLFTQAIAQVVVWFCVVVTLIAFAASRTRYLVCQITDPDRTEYCGYGEAYDCTVAASVFLLPNLLLGFQVLKPGEAAPRAAAVAKPDAAAHHGVSAWSAGSAGSSAADAPVAAASTSTAYGHVSTAAAGTTGYGDGGYNSL
jgi:hypothetical protein